MNFEKQKINFQKIPSIINISEDLENLEKEIDNFCLNELEQFRNGENIIFEEKEMR